METDNAEMLAWSEKVVLLLFFKKWLHRPRRSKSRKKKWLEKRRGRPWPERLLC